MKQGKKIKIDSGFNWQLASEKVQTGYGGAVAQFEESSQNLIWNIFSDFITAGRIGRAANPELRTGREYVFHK